MVLFSSTAEKPPPTIVPSIPFPLVSIPSSQDNTILGTTPVKHSTIHDTTLAGQSIILPPNAETTQSQHSFPPSPILLSTPHPTPSPIPPTRPPTLNTHPMVTRSKNNVFKPSTKYAFVSTTPDVAPAYVTQTLKLLEWC